MAEQGCLLSSYPDKIGIGGSNPPLSAMSTKISKCYWKILIQQALSYFRFFRCSLYSLPISLQSPLFSS